MANNTKQYGLILPQKANQGLVRPRPSVFNESSDSEEEGQGATDWMKKALKRESEKNFQRRQHQVDIQKALAEDPTVYQYDEVYDKIEEKKAEVTTAKKLDKKPRYIQSLMLQAEKRKREQERRNERIIQKEREAEGDKFKDKESFVTSAYKAKLEEFRQQEEEEKRMDAIEALIDVTKQKDLGGFYRHLYRQTVSGEGEGSTIVKQEKGTDTLKEDGQQTAEDVDQEERGVVKTEKDEAPGGDEQLENSEKKTGRHYRKRNHSSASSNSEGEKDEHSNKNLDADSDFSVDSDSSDSESESNSEKGDEKKKGNTEKSNSHDKETVEDTNKDAVQTGDSGKTSSEKRGAEDVDKSVKKVKVGNGEVISEDKGDLPKKEEKVKHNIWIKRTVGEVFESALQRYYERKANRLANKGL